LLLHAKVAQQDPGWPDQIGRFFAQWVIVKFGPLLLKITEIAHIFGPRFRRLR
jgi:hypothetical protein